MTAIAGEWRPKKYVDRGRTLRWEQSLSEATMAAMDAGEVFTLMGADGKPYSLVLKDSYGTIREKQVT
jgi:hypothetical protein